MIMDLPWSELIAQQTGYIRSCARKFLHDPEESKDLAQDILLKALQNEGNFLPGSNIKAWLFTLTRNLFISNYQRAKRFQRVDLSDELYSGFDSLGFHLNDGVEAINIELIYKAVENLKEPFRAIIKMRMEGVKYEEIAETMNVPCGTIKNRIFIARAKMNEFLLSKQNNPFYMQAISSNTSNNNMIAQNSMPVAVKATPKSNYQKILDRLFLLIPTTEHIAVDRPAVSKYCDVPSWMVDQAISALIRKEALVDLKQGNRKIYKRLPAYSTYTDAELEADVKAHIAPKEKVVEKVSVPDKKELLKLVFVTEPVSEPEPTKIEKATEQFQAPMAAYEYGFLCPIEGLQWFTSKDEAAQKAKESSIANKMDRLHIMQKIGVVVNEPTVTFY